MPIPEGQGKANLLVAVANTRQSVFSPAIGFGASCIVWKIIPCCSIGAVVFAHCSPGAFTYVRPPSFPVDAAFPTLRESFMFCRHLHNQFPPRCMRCMFLCFIYSYRHGWVENVTHTGLLVTLFHELWPSSALKSPAIIHGTFTSALDVLFA